MPPSTIAKSCHIFFALLPKASNPDLKLCSHHRHRVLHHLNPPNVPQYVEHCPAKAALASSSDNTAMPTRSLVLIFSPSSLALRLRHCTTSQRATCAV